MQYRSRLCGRRISVRNPSEFFAAMGLLELVQTDNTRAHFEAKEGDAQVTFVIEKHALLPDLRTLSITALEHENPLIAPINLREVRLDWWLNRFGSDKSPLKLWAGTTTPAAMLRHYQSLMAPDFDLHYLVRSGVKSCFNFDTRSSRDAIDAGYSEKQAGVDSVIYPYIEFLCAVGLQNFRPWNMEYFTWGRPIPVNIAHAAATMIVPGLQQQGQSFAIELIGTGLKQVTEVAEISL
jgi:CRISPR-associated protein Csb3